MTAPADKRAEQYRQIHGLVRLLGMNDEAYRDMLRDRYSVESSKQLSTQQRGSLIKSLREQVHGNVAEFNDLVDRKKHLATPKQLRAIDAMWAKVSRATTPADRKNALNAFVKRLTGIDNVRWITMQDARTLIRAIHAMGAQSPEEFNRNKNTNQR